MTPEAELDVDGFCKRKLSRYLPFSRFVFLLRHGLYIPNVTQFTDRWDGLLGARLRQRLPESMRARYAIEDYESALRWIHVSCWYRGVRENFLMWKAYGATEEAVMVESSVARVKKLYRESNELHVGYLDAVRYYEPGNEPSHLRLPSLIAPWGMPRPISRQEGPDLVDFLPEMFIKYDHYEGERECRLVCLNKRHTEDAGNANGGLILPLGEPQFLIERVRLSPFASEATFETVSLLMERFAPGVPVERSKIEIRT